MMAGGRAAGGGITTPIPSSDNLGPAEEFTGIVSVDDGELGDDEVGRDRWGKIAGFVHGMFRLDLDRSSWYDAQAFVEYYT